MARLAGADLKDPQVAAFRASSPAHGVQVSSGKGSRTRQQLGKGLNIFLTLISVMSARGWEDARKSKIPQISQEGKKKLECDCSPGVGTGTLGHGLGSPSPPAP